MTEKSSNEKEEESRLDQDSKSSEQDSWNKMFSDRYTEQDPEYLATISTPLADPPVIENWYSRNNRRGNYQRGRGRGDYRQHNYQHSHNSNHPHANDYYNRNRGHSGSYESGGNYGDKDRYSHQRQHNRYQPYGRNQSESSGYGNRGNRTSNVPYS